jgi:hypothetical protein
MVLVQQQLSDHIGYNIIHWIISQSGIWYTKFNENIQSNLRTIESGVAVIDEILTPQDDDLLYELNNQYVDHDRAYYYHQNIRLNDNYYANGNENYGNQLHGNLRGINTFCFIICPLFLSCIFLHIMRDDGICTRRTITRIK